ncbi:MAG TPA: hypothetical protein DCZ92_14045 [Elusimicrobia bacterium]|nr:MAG: hypothetical protein A2016_05385 [Elusimicrobia bacterium GWF2_62_30]HBA61903.1 hypothetical protein [Elusimicrobiota bacterium]
MMKKISAVLAVMLLAASAALAQEEKAKGEAVVMPDIELVDIPTAGILDYGGFLMKTRFYNDGGVQGGLNFGVMERLNLGATMTVDKLIGNDSPIRMRRPEIQVKFRFYDGGYYVPAVALGYDSQGYYYNPDVKKYREKGKGLYLVGSKEVGISNFVLHGGFNVPDFDNSYFFGFVGANYTLEDKLSFILEYDNVFHTDDPSRFNAGMRIYITPYFQLDMALREIGRSGEFEANVPRKPERIVQLRYNTSF